MKAETLRDMSYEELLSQQTLLQKEIFELRLKKARGETPKAGEQKAKRRDLARVLTVINEYRAAMQVVGNDEEAAVKALRLHKWDAIATVADLEIEKLVKETGVSAKVAKLAIRLGQDKRGQTDLVRARNLIVGAEKLAGGKDEAKLLGALAQLNRDGLETALSFRKALEAAVNQAVPGTPAVVVRGALADNRYNLDKATAEVAAVAKLAQESGADAPKALIALQGAQGDAVLALKRLKKQAKVAAKV